MNQRLINGILRSTIYIAGGVLPALGLALLSLLFTIFGDVFGILLSALAWLGTSGLVLAALIRPSTAGSRGRLVISVMLVIGLIVIFPVLIYSLTHPSSKMWFGAVVLGPTLLALHYLWQVARSSRAEE
jgi:uncharacterized membrane protein